MAKRAAAFYSYEYICPMEMWHDSLTPVVHTIQCEKLNKFEFDLETKMKERSEHWKHFFIYILRRMRESKTSPVFSIIFFNFPLHTKTASSRENTELFVQCFTNVLKHDNFMCSKIELNIEMLMVF